MIHDINIVKISSVHAEEQAVLQSSFLEKSLSLSESAVHDSDVVDNGLRLNTKIGVSGIVAPKDDIPNIDR